MELDEAYKQLLDEYFVLTLAEDKYRIAITAGFESSTESAVEGNKMLTEDQKTKMRKGMARVKKLLLEEMKWQTIKPKLMQVYANHYTKAELSALSRNLKNESIQMMLRKELGVLPETMKVGQEEALKLQPKIQQIMIEEMMAQ